MTALASPDVAAPPRRGHHPGLALAVIAGAQLMIVLDATIVNIALPHIQTALNFSDTGLSWVLNAYTLTFGGLLLLGGRAGDILGRRRMFMAGIGLFILASLAGGFAQNSGELLTARAIQGIGGAIASPTALALLATNFAEGKERNRAFGVFAAVSGSGAAIGLLLGGMLTQWLSWRWVLYVNVPIGLVLLAAIPMFVAESQRHRGRFDITGALTSTVGMSSLVYAFIHAADQGWTNNVTLGAFAVAIALLAAFVATELRTAEPIMPMRLFADRNRASGYLVMTSFAAGMMGMFFFLTLFVQNVLGYSSLKAGLAFLPISFVIAISAQISSRMMLRTGPKPFMFLGALLATSGLVWLTQVDQTTPYLALLGPMMLFGFGMGFIFVPLTMLAVAGVSGKDSGAASAMLNVTQQVGGSLGLSILVTAFSSAQKHEQTAVASAPAMRDFLAGLSPAQLGLFKQGKLAPPAEITHQVLSYGISHAFIVAAVFGGIGLLLSLLIRNLKGGPAEMFTAPADTGADGLAARATEDDPDSQPVTT